MNLIETIKDRVSCVQYMHDEHHEQINNGRCRSFRSGAENRTSLKVDDRYWYDFGSSKYGDIIDLCAEDKGYSKGEAIKYLAHQYGVENYSYRYDVVFDTHQRILNDAVHFYTQNMPEIITAYIRERGIRQATIEELKIGFSVNPCDYLLDLGYDMTDISQSGICSFLNRIMIPYLDAKGNTKYLIGRESPFASLSSSNPTAKYVKLHRTEYNEHAIWGVPTLSRQGSVIIAEGAFDAISCYQEGFPVLSAITGSFSSEQKKDLYNLLRGRDVIICMDYDPDTHAGQKFTARLAQDLFEHGVKVKVCLLNGGDKKKDLSELYARHPCRETLDDIFASVEDYELLLIKQNLEDLEKLEPTMRKIWQVRGETYLTYVSQCVWDKYGKQVASALLRNAKRPLTEEEVFAEFVKRHPTHKYISGVGDLSYSSAHSRYIVDLTESDLYSKIDKIYGIHARNATTQQMINKIHNRVNYSIDVLEKDRDFFNFRNCLFNISSGEVKEHTPDIVTTVQLPYVYDEKATCPKFIEFLRDIFNGEEDKIKVVQEMFGYCLTRDARYQKCFSLLGEGANGKSTLMDILCALITDANVSNVPISSLDSEFQRIRLMGKYVNLAPEIKSNVSGTEYIFKQIVAGETISGSYKFKQNVEFKPFCKFIFSSNEELKTSDSSFGFSRRIIFLSFPNKYVDDPKKKNERKIKVNLREELLEELPGIFNFAVEGLARLRKQNAFTETKEQAEVLGTFKRLNNPLISFVEEVIDEKYASGWYRREDIYQKYCEWCSLNNNHPRANNSFWIAIRKIKSVKDRREYGFRQVCFSEALNEV